MARGVGVGAGGRVLIISCKIRTKLGECSIDFSLVFIAIDGRNISMICLFIMFGKFQISMGFDDIFVIRFIMGHR